MSGADVYYHTPCGERLRSRPDVQRFLDRQKKAGNDRYLAVTVSEFDFSSRGVNVRPRMESIRDFNLAGTWVYLSKKDDGGSVAKASEARKTAPKPAVPKPTAARATLTAFEREREERIQRNKEQLVALNIGPLTAGLAEANDGGSGRGGGKRRRVKDDDGPVRRSLRGMNIPPDAELAAGIDAERRNGTVVLATDAAVVGGSQGSTGDI